MRKNNKDDWFKQRRYGYGWTPINWKGWVSALVYISIILGGLVIIKDVPENDFTIEVAVYLTLVLVATLIFLAISLKKGPKPQWRWGDKPEDDSPAEIDRDSK